MKEQLYVHIPTPCHEDWNKMTPENKGRFCDSCAKTVVDFSVMTDNDVLNYFNKNKGNLCGRFADDQLQRPLIETQLQPKKGFKYWLASVAALFVLMNKGTARVAECDATAKRSEMPKATPAGYKKMTGDTMPVPVRRIIVGKPAYNTQRVSGIITDDNGEEIGGASVIIKETGAKVIANGKGEFSVQVNHYSPLITFVVSSIGFESKEVIIDVLKDTKPVIHLKKKEIVLPEVTIVSYSTTKRTISSGVMISYNEVKKADTIKTVIAKISRSEKFTILPDKKNILYPNPVQRNGSVTLSIKEVGDYELQVLDNQSKLLYSQQYTTQSKTQAISFPVPASTLPGMYYVRLINQKTKKQWVDRVVVQ